MSSSHIERKAGCASQRDHANEVPVVADGSTPVVEALLKHLLQRAPHTNVDELEVVSVQEALPFPKCLSSAAQSLAVHPLHDQDTLRCMLRVHAWYVYPLQYTTTKEVKLLSCWRHI